MPFNEEIKQLTINDRNHADVFNEIHNDLLENTKHNKEEIDETKEVVDDLNVKKHTHENKSILDTITDVLVGSWNRAVEHIDDAIKHITGEERTLWNTVSDKVDKIEGKVLSSNDYTTEEKDKLSGIEDSANNYIHPDNTNTRHVTDAEKSTWNAKAPTTVVSATGNGLMSKDDKIKLDGMDAGANKYVHPSNSGNKHIPSGGSAGQILRWESDGTARWGNENTSGGGGSGTLPDIATPTSDGLMSKEDKAKLDGVATGANNYTHPDNANTRHVTDAEKSAWNAKASTAAATASANGLMSKEDKAKLNGIATGANNYTHPATHPPTIIAQNSTNRFVTDAEKTTWNSKASTAVSTTKANGLMSKEDKAKMDNLYPNKPRVAELGLNNGVDSIDADGRVTGGIVIASQGTVITIYFYAISGWKRDQPIAYLYGEQIPPRTMMFRDQESVVKITKEGEVYVMSAGSNGYISPITYVTGRTR